MRHLLPRLGMIARRGIGRVMPDPFILAVLLTGVVLAAGVLFGDLPGGAGSRGLAALGAWRDGVWGFATFAMQVTVMLVFGAAAAEAPAFRRLLDGAAAAAPSPRLLVAIVAASAGVLGLINWTLALVGGGLLAREAGRVAADRGWTLHYPLLCSAGYSGLMIWHGGLSGTAPLKATTERDLVEVLGPDLAGAIGPLGLSETVLSPMNLFTSGGLLLLGAAFFAALVPDRDPEAWSIPAAARRAAAEPAPGSAGADAHPAAPRDEGRPGGPELPPFARSRWVTGLLLVPLAGATVLRLRERGLGNLDLDTVNLLLWTAALALHGRPDRFLAACQRGLSACTGVVVQFPLYAGIMGVMNGVGLTQALSQVVASAGAEGVAPVTFLSAGLVNLFVPSGGGQWGVQGPVVMQAALDAGVAPARVLLALAYGDQWTNMLQPFWALPLLAITGVRARDIIGYTALWMLVGGAFMLSCLVLFPA